MFFTPNIHLQFMSHMMVPHYTAKYTYQFGTGSIVCAAGLNGLNP